MGKKFDFEYIVIGSGPAGSAVAVGLAGMRKKVAVIDGSEVGGSNCERNIPYLVGLKFANLYDETKKWLGMRALGLNHFNLPTIVSLMEQASQRAKEVERKKLKDAGVVEIKGYANLLNNYTVAVGKQQFSAEKLILATGAELNIGEISGVGEVDYLTPETAIKTRRMPRVVLVVGGGRSGCEIGEYFAKLGVKVLIMERAERLLPREDQEVGEMLAEHFYELGVEVINNAKVVALEKDGENKRVIFMKDGVEKLVRVDAVVLATGTKPVLNYGLENAGVQFNKTGVIMSKNLQTTTKNIFAVGDILGGDSSTELATYQGMMLAQILERRSKDELDYKGFWRQIMTEPEILTIGFSEDDLIKRDQRYRKAISDMTEAMAGKISTNNRGFVKLLVDHNNRLIGAVIMAEKMGAMATELILAIRNQMTIDRIASLPHDINSSAIMIKIAAQKLMK